MKARRLSVASTKTDFPERITSIIMLLNLGIKEDNLKMRDHDKEELSHYSNSTTDIEFKFPFGFKEVEGIHSRTDFDLSAHQELSGKKLQYFDPETNKSFVPFVVETSIGVDRMFLQIMAASYKEEETFVLG